MPPELYRTGTFWEGGEIEGERKFKEALEEGFGE